MDSGYLGKVGFSADKLNRLTKTSRIDETSSEAGRLDTSGARRAKATGSIHVDAREQLFALEQHIPAAILRNPLLMKAEWAWKLLLLQQLFSESTAADAEKGLFSSEHGGHDTATNEALPSGQARTLPAQLAQVAVRQLWELLGQAESDSAQHQSVNLTFRTDPPLIPFSAMNQDTVKTASSRRDERRLSRWIVEDRLISSVLDNPYERIGAGLFFPSQTTSPASSHHAVRWEAHRQTRIGSAGNLVHRLRLEVDVRGKPLACVVTAQRPQVLVHFVSDDVQLLHHLQKGEELMVGPLRQCGWELIGWSTASSDVPTGEGEQR